MGEGVLERWRGQSQRRRDRESRKKERRVVEVRKRVRRHEEKSPGKID